MGDFLLNYFTPDHIVNKVCPEYDKLRNIVLSVLVAASLLLVLPLPLIFVFPQASLYYGIFIMCVTILFTIKRTGTYLLPTVATLAIGYGIVVYIILISGALFSPHVIMLYLLMLTGFWTDRKIIGHPTVLVNLVAFYIIYVYTAEEPFKLSMIDDRVSTKQYFLLFNFCVTLFFGVFFSFVKRSYEFAQNEVREAHLSRINNLTEAVNDRNRELEGIRKNLATDFHDETGNLLAVINQQAQILQIKLSNNPEFSSITGSLINHSQQLYNTSRNFIWSTHNESNNPIVAFYHLIEFGQDFFNQFDIEFSAKPLDKSYFDLLKMPSSANRDLIAIFKEAMTNTAKHSGAKNVLLRMFIENGYLNVELKDDGRWKEPDPSSPSSGLQNMESRSLRNHFLFSRLNDGSHTYIKVRIIISNA